MRSLVILLLLIVPLSVRCDEPVMINQGLQCSLIEQHAEPRGDFTSVTIPLKRIGRLMLIEATVDGIAGNFVFDTGATQTVLNLTYFRDELQKAFTTAGGATGSTREVYYTHVDSLSFAGICYENFRADVANLGHIENQRGVKILGLLGMSLFKSLEMEMDLRNNLLILRRIDKFGVPLESSESAEFPLVYPIRIQSGAMFVKCEAAGKTIECCLDTGAETNVVHSSVSRKVMETITITRRSNLTGSGSRQMEVLYGTMNELLLGTEALHPMSTIISNLDALALAYDYPLDAVLGYDFFEKGVFCINLVKKEMKVRLHGGQRP